MKNAIEKEIFKEIFPKKYKKHRIGQDIYERLKKRILNGKIRQGERLVEERLANQFNVSRNPIRMAILQLREDGLVVWKFKKGTFVK